MILLSETLEVAGYGSYGLTQGNSTEEGAVSWCLANAQQLRHLHLQVKHMSEWKLYLLYGGCMTINICDLAQSRSLHQVKSQEEGL